MGVEQKALFYDTCPFYFFNVMYQHFLGAHMRTTSVCLHNVIIVRLFVSICSLHTFLQIIFFYV